MSNQGGKDSTRLAVLTETADGWRDEKLQLVYDDNTGLSIKREGDKLTSSESKVCDIVTPSIQKDRTKVVSVTLETADGASHKFAVDPEGWDALFWSESSIGKFVYPYYHAQRIWNEDLETLQNSFDSYPMAFAIRHKAPSSLAAMGAESSLEVAALSMSPTAAGKGPVSNWYSPQGFNDLVSAYRVAQGAAHGARGRGQGTPESKVEPSRTR